MQSIRPHLEKGGGAIFLGYGSLYNSSGEPNLAGESAVDEERMIFFTALRDIEPGEELTYKYAWPDWVARTGSGPVDADGLPLEMPRRSQGVQDSSSAVSVTTASRT